MTPVSAETWLNANGTQYYSALITALILCEGSTQATRLKRHIFRLLLMINSLNGLLSCTLTPLYWIKAWRNREREVAIQAAILSLGCMLQVVTPEETHALCRTLDIDDLQPTGREQVRQGFPSGSLDQARADLARVVAGNLLPLCEERKPAPQPTPSPQPTPTPAPTAEPTATGEPTAPPPAPVPETTTPPSTTPAQIPGQNCRPD